MNADDSGPPNRDRTIEVHLRPGGGAEMAATSAPASPKPKELSPKYFYDERGSELFERITELPEYYPTRAERAILERPLGADPRRGRRARGP